MLGQRLTADECSRYSKSHQRLLLAMAVALGYSVGIVLVDRIISLEAYGLYLGMGSLPITAFVIWAMANFRCPVCRSTPRAKALNFTSGQATYSSMVALFPKSCSHCGVRFLPGPPHREA
jgi:hypothetical protein